MVALFVAVGSSLFQKTFRPSNLLKGSHGIAPRGKKFVSDGTIKKTNLQATRQGRMNQDEMNTNMRKGYTYVTYIVRYINLYLVT